MYNQAWYNCQRVKFGDLLCAPPAVNPLMDNMKKYVYQS